MQLFPVPSTKTLFNLYRDKDPRVDRPDADKIRRENFANYLNTFPRTPRILLVGEAPGPWGYRFSGIPFTGERQLILNALPFSGQQSSRDKPLLRLEKKPPFISNSSKYFWTALAQHHPKFFVWDAVPLHPHKPGKILSIRAPTGEEITEFSGLMRSIIEIMRPKLILAVGRKAGQALTIIGVPFQYVPHPSHGHAAEFARETERFFRKAGSL